MQQNYMPPEELFTAGQTAALMINRMQYLQ